MRALMSFLMLAAVVVAAGTFWACNERLDDPTLSEGLLTVEKVEPAIVQGDRMDNVDPNSGQIIPITADEVTVTIKNRPRIPDTGGLTDVFLGQATRVCTNQNGATVATGVSPISFTIPSGGSAAVTSPAALVSEKINNAVDGDTWSCIVGFSGVDLAGNPAGVAAGFTVSIFD